LSVADARMYRSKAERKLEQLIDRSVDRTLFRPVAPTFDLRILVGDGEAGAIP